MVITFPDDVLADAARYRAAASLPPAAITTAADDDAVRARKDLAVEGFGALVEGGPEALDRFHRRAAALVAPSISAWRPIWEAGPVAAVEATGVHLTALESGDASHLAASAVHALPPPGAERRYGCCGTLGVIQPSTS